MDLRDHPPIDPGQVFEKLAKVLTILHGQVAALEESSLNRIAPADPLTPVALQDFDLVMQSLQELARFTATLGRHQAVLTSHNIATAVADIKLEWLRNQLLGTKAVSDRADAQVVVF
jgi:predicted lipid carrier protein YhbT